MQVASIVFNEVSTKNRVTYTNYRKDLQAKNFDVVSFKKLLPENAKIKLAIFDIDETLRKWDSKCSEEESQKIRTTLFNYVKSNKMTLVYSSDRGFSKIVPLIDDGTLAKPDWIVCNNGGAIYKNVEGSFEEVKNWSDTLIKNFQKDKVRTLMAKIANEPENMFTPEEWAKVPPEIIPEGQKEFRGSKITEYVGNESPINIRLIMAPGMYEKNVKKIDQTLKSNGIDAKLILLHYPYGMISYECLLKYFDPKVSLDASNHYIPRLYPDKSADTLVITATDKGMASEYIRKELKLKNNEVFAAGDGENDFSNANKGYFFALISNAAEGLKKMLSKTSQTNVIETTRPGAEGILEVLV